MGALNPSKEVTTQNTPLSPEDAWVFFSGFSDWSPKMRLWAFLLWLVETGSGAKCYNYNWGNLAAGGYSNGVESAWWSGNYRRPSWFFDASSSLHAAMLKGQAPSAFRAPASHEQGAAQYHSLLNGSRYEPLRAAAESDEPAEWVQQLHDTGYSQDYKAKHVPTFAYLRQKWDHLLPKQKAPPTCPECGQTVCPVCGRVLASS